MIAAVNPLFDVTKAEVAAAYITGLFTLLAAILAFGGLAWQLARQGRLQRQAQDETERQRIKADVLADFRQQVELVVTHIVDLSSRKDSFSQLAGQTVSRDLAKIDTQLLRHSLTDLVKVLAKLSESMNFVGLLSIRYRLVDKRIASTAGSFLDLSVELMGGFDSLVQRSQIFKVLKDEALLKEPEQSTIKASICEFLGGVSDFDTIISRISSQSDDLLSNVQRLVFGDLFNDEIDSR